MDKSGRIHKVSRDVPEGKDINKVWEKINEGSDRSAAIEKIREERKSRKNLK